MVYTARVTEDDSGYAVRHKVDSCIIIQQEDNLKWVYLQENFKIHVEKPDRSEWGNR